MSLPSHSGLYRIALATLVKVRVGWLVEDDNGEKLMCEKVEGWQGMPWRTMKE